MLELAGFQGGKSHVRPSKRSLAERARVSGGSVPIDVVHSCEEEYSITTHALLVWLAAWSAGSHMKGWPAAVSQQLRDRAQLLLSILVRGLLDSDSYDVFVGGTLVRIASHTVPTQSLCEALPHCRRRLAAMHGDVDCSVCDVLRLLGTLVFKPCQNELAVGEARHAFCTFVECLATVFETTRSVEKFEAASYLHMPVLRGPTGKVRRLSSSAKVAISQAVASDKDVKDPSDLIASKRLLKRSCGEFDLEVPLYAFCQQVASDPSYES